MNTQRAMGAQGSADMLSRQPLLIQTVADLVQDTEEAFGEAATVVARRQPTVPRPDSATERMGGQIQSTGVEVEADRGSPLFGQDLLLVNGVVTVEEGAVGLA